MRQTQRSSESNDLEAVRARLAHRPLVDETHENETAQTVEETPTYLLGGAGADIAAGLAAGLLPLLAFVVGNLSVVRSAFMSAFGDRMPGYSYAVLYLGIGLAVVDVLAFFVALRPYRTLRIVLSLTLSLYTMLPAAVLGAIGFNLLLPQSSTSLESWSPWAYLSIAGGLVALQVVLWRTAFRRR